MPCVAVAFDTPAAECRARNRARAKRIPADVLTGQLRGVGGGPRRGCATRATTRCWRPSRCGWCPSAFVGARRRPARQQDAADRAAVRAAPRRVRLHGGAAATAGLAARGRRGRGGGRLRRDLRHGPLPADPADRPRLGRLARELDDAGLPGRVHRAGPARHAGHAASPTATSPTSGRSSPPSTCSAAAGRSAASASAGSSRSTRRTAGRSRPTAERYALLEDALRAAAAAVGPGQPGRSAGRVLEVPEAMCYPRPLQEHVPILVGGGGERRTLRLAAQYADAANVFGDARHRAPQGGRAARALRRRRPGPGGGRAHPPVDGAGRAGRRARWPRWSSQLGRAGAARRATPPRSTPARSTTTSAGSASWPRPACAEVMIRLPDLADPGALELMAEVVAAFR